MSYASRTKKFKIILSVFQLVEADISFDCDTRSRVSQIRIVAGDNGKSFAFWFP